MASAATVLAKSTSGTMDWESLRKRLLGKDMNDALNAGRELKDVLETVPKAEIPAMLSTLIPIVSSILLLLTKPNPDANSKEYCFRKVILEFVGRMPFDEVARAHAPKLLDTVMEVLSKDFEENALLASRAIFFLHKHYRPMPQDQVQPYLEFVQSAYRALPTSVQKNFHIPPPIPGGASTPSKPEAPSPFTAQNPFETPMDSKTTGHATSVKEDSVFSASPGYPTTPTPKQTLKAISSFRVLTECPLTVMLLFQLYPASIKSMIPNLIQLMMEALAIRAPPLQSMLGANQEIQSQHKRLYYTRSRELVAAQTKILSFLTYLQHGFSEQMKTYEERIASNVVSLMKICTREAIGPRKELLVATRHFLGSDFRKGFFRHIDSLLDERILMGSHHRHSAQTIIKPLGYSTLAELVQHVRSMLSLKQLSRVVHIFSRVLHDPSMKLPMPIQFQAVRLLLNLVDICYQNKDPNPQIGRDLLDRILDTLVSKLGTLKDQIPAVREAALAEMGAAPTDVTAALSVTEPSTTTMSSEDNKQTDDVEMEPEKDQEDAIMKDADSPTDETKDAKLDDQKVLEEIINAETWMLSGAKESDSLREVQSMVRCIVVSMKTVVWCITNYRQPRDKDKGREGGSEEPPPMTRLTLFERDVVEKYVEYGLPCITVFGPLHHTESDAESATTSSKISYEQEQTSAVQTQQLGDVLTDFAACFANLDGFNLRRTLGKRMQQLIDAIMEDSTFMAVPHRLMNSSRRASVEFSDMLLRYLTQHIEALAVPRATKFVFLSSEDTEDEKEDRAKKLKNAHAALEATIKDDRKEKEKISSVLLDLFERVMKSLSSYPDNEGALRPYLQGIVASSLRLSMERGGDWPDYYCTLLRTSFRAISAGKFESSYKELLPMIPTILNGLHRIFKATEDEQLRNTIIELSLTIPARLSSLLPHMPLLLRMIIPSIKSEKGDLVNLGLRTLEFWVDNLNPEFLYPILGKQTAVFSDLMCSLTRHLRPAPYPYGILTVRLLGKLGGKNRRFLREILPEPYLPGIVPSDDQMQTALENFDSLCLECEWSLEDAEEIKKLIGCMHIDIPPNSPRGGFTVPMPIKAAVEALLVTARIPADLLSIQAKAPTEFEQKLRHIVPEDIGLLLSVPADSVDLEKYCSLVVESTVKDQALAAIHVLSMAISQVLDLGDLPPDLSSVRKVDEADSTAPDVSLGCVSAGQKTNVLKVLVRGLFYGLASRQVHEQSSIHLKGIFSYLLALLSSHCEHITRIDAHGSRTSAPEEPESSARPNKDALGSLRPFGYFGISGPFEKADPFSLCEVIGDALTHPLAIVRSSTLKFVESLIKDCLDFAEVATSGLEPPQFNKGVAAFFECLLETFCSCGVSQPWNLLAELRSAVCTLMTVFGCGWAKQFEIELVHLSISSVKNAPNEIALAGVKAFNFFAVVLNLLYGTPDGWSPDTAVTDSYCSDTSSSSGDSKTVKETTVASPKGEDNKTDDVATKGEVEEKETSEGEDKKEAKDMIEDNSEEKEENESKANDDAANISHLVVSETALSLLIQELASTKQLTRFAARFALRSYVFHKANVEEREKRVDPHMSTVKRVVFTRSLRLLPLPEQVAVIEALTALVDFVPSLLPISDQHLLAFLSEFLKLSSIADGEMADTSISGFVVDKNGFTSQPSSRKSRDSKCVTAVFCRRDCFTKLDHVSVIIPEELPLGVHVRVAALRLFNTVIRRHVDGFFDADVKTPIGNIRPHVISLLFRSLVSESPVSVRAAHEALRNVLSLSVVTKDDAEGSSRSQSRLPKELLQTCIRPVLLNLRDYTRLSVPLLRGLARLLSLLSSWFNKTLGEKLLEHLQKWADPDTIISCNIWKPGQEPVVASRILDLFALLPHASHFVEPLVKTVIKLEAALPRFKGHQEVSPYRKPLARYLNKQHQSTINFFFLRLQTPMYSELFQDVVALKESDALRSYLKGQKCSVTILNLCFERPLAVIRSEKNSVSKSAAKGSSGSPTVAEMYSIHGITVDGNKKKEAMLRQEIEGKKKKLLVLQKEATRTKEAFQAQRTGGASDSLEDAKRRHRNAQAAFDKAQKDLSESTQKYKALVAPAENKDSKVRKMTVEALELQQQGFQLVETLVTYSSGHAYMTDHTDIVRALRWLWRSKGRHLRLQHEELMPPRFQKESKILGSLVVKYAESEPGDVDVLFEFLRIFVQPVTYNVDFIKDFIAHAVSHILTTNKKKQILDKFFSLLGGEGVEETKVLSNQLIVMPMLLGATRKKVEIPPLQTGEDGKEDNTKEAQSVVHEIEVLFDSNTIKKFVHEILLKNDAPVSYGERLRVELLRILTLLVQSIPSSVDEFRKDAIKFPWSLLKSEDSSCKSWAYLNVCQFIETYDIPSNVILQVFGGLIRMFHHQWRGFVRSALSILIPTFQAKLCASEVDKIVDYTIRVTFEEANNVQQLAHIWQTVIAHSGAFCRHKAQLAPHMINSLNKLGLAANCSMENRALSLSLAELVLSWNNVASKETSRDSSPAKRMKLEGGEALNMQSEFDIMEESMVANAANFLVRMSILLADVKAEANTATLEEKTVTLFRLLMKKYPSCEVNPAYFEKVVSMCKEEVAAMKNPESADKPTREKGKARAAAKSPGRKSSSKAGSSQNPSGSQDDIIGASSTRLVACLKIFIVLFKDAPTNKFLSDNVGVVNDILEPCFMRAGQRDGCKIRTKLREFILPLLTVGYKTSTHSKIIQYVEVLLESFIVKSMDSTAMGPGNPDSEGSRRDERRSKDQHLFPCDEGRSGGSCIAIFSLTILNEVVDIYPYIVDRFVGSLVALAEKLSARHLHEVNSGQRKSTTASLVGRGSSLHKQHASPTIGIMEEAYALGLQRDVGKHRKSSEKTESESPWQRVSEIGTLLRSIVCCMRLVVGSSVVLNFGENRQKFLRTLGAILDSSDNIHLLLTAVSVVGHWLTEDHGTGPLSLTEHTTLFKKIADLDGRLNSTVVAQPLADLTSHIILAIAKNGNRSRPGLQGFRQGGELDSKIISEFFENGQTLFHRCLVAQLMNSNKSTRSTAYSLYSTHLDISSANATFSGKAQSWELQGQKLFGMLWQLLHSDFEGICGRLWSLVFVEMLIRGSEAKGVRSVVGWLPRPNMPAWEKSIQTNSQDNVNALYKCLGESSQSYQASLHHVLTLAHGNQKLIQDLFESLILSAWENVGLDTSRSSLIRPIEKLLSQPHNARAFCRSSGATNAVQSVLRALAKLNPTPVLDRDLMLSLVHTHRVWHEVLFFLEHELRVIGPSEDTCQKESVLKGIKYCLNELGETNAGLGLCHEIVQQPQTTFATSLDIYGMINDAIHAYRKLMEMVQENVEVGNDPTDFEMDVWEERWVSLERDMCQLPVIADYAANADNHELLFETAWKNQEWDKVDNLNDSSQLIPKLEAGDATIKMMEILLSITRGKLHEVENLHAQTAQLCLQQWQQIPNVSNGSGCHSSLLHFFHRLLEFRESGHFMVEARNHSNRKTLPDLKYFLSAWRHRLPNDYDRLSDWDDIITWRTHMFSAITSNFQWSEVDTLPTLHDRPWTVIRMAKTARKQGIREVAMLSLGKISDGSMDVSDAFSRVREQILTFNNPDSEMERTGGLNMVNTTNLSFFEDSQKSELLRLKAQFLSSLGLRSKANQSYCHAVQVCPSYARSWVSWGGLCSSLGRLAEKQQIEQQAADQSPGKESTKVAQYLAQAMGCYLEAVQCDSNEWCRIHLPKCLWMLAKDGSSPGVLCQTLETRGAALPCWVWLPWCPQLLTSLYRTEGKAVKSILTTLAKTYPQALYFPLRAFYLERRDVERSKGSSSSSSHQGSVLHSEELMSSLRRAHASLWSSLEAILEELIVKFRPSYEEELLSTMAALLDRAETQIDASLHSGKENSGDDDAVASSIAKTLGRISTKFFRETSPDTPSSKRDERTRKAETFKLKFKAVFEEDFLSSNTNDEKEKIALKDYLARLQKWKNLLENQVASTPHSLPLVESSQSLALFATEVPDLWPMSCDPKAASDAFEVERKKEERPAPASTSSSSAQAARTAATSAAIAVANAAASKGRGGEYGGGSSAIEIPGQYVPNTISAIDSKPSPELHAKLVRFESRIQVVRVNDQLVRCVGMVGSDGRCYRFLLQFAIPYWTRTDERTVQLSYILDKILRRDVIASRNFLSTRPTPVIPIAQRLRMVQISTNSKEKMGDRLSLNDVFRRRCRDAGCSTSAVSQYYQARIKKLLEMRKSDEISEEDRLKLVTESKEQVLREICNKQVDPRMLLTQIQQHSGSPEGLFHYRRTFAGQLGINSLMQHAFSVAVRTPSRMVLNRTTGEVYSPEFRLSYNNQGFLENQKVPFRMTPNLRELVGPTMMQGRFVPTMCMTARAIKSSMEDVDAILRLLIRDDITAWYTSKSMAKSDTKTQELEKQLADRVAKNVGMIESKISECAGKKVPNDASTKLPITPIDQRVRDLLVEASGYEKLATMESSFQPWL